jgi:hypothetical protein
VPLAFRDGILSEWTALLAAHDAPVSAHFRLCDAVETPVARHLWHRQGLPRDRDVADAAAIVVTACRYGRFPLICDPQGVAERWLRAKDAADRGVTLGTWPLSAVAGSDAATSTLHKALTQGAPLLLEVSAPPFPLLPHPYL